MNKKLLSSAFIMALSLTVLSSITAANAISIQTLGSGKMTYVIANIGSGSKTVDPALAYDTASGELIRNVYDTLVFFKGTDPGSVVPWLASSYTVTGGLTYSFTIRSNVTWHDFATYGYVTPEDVVYSLQRVLVRDYTGGPAWMLYFPIFGVYTAHDLIVKYGNDVAAGIAIDNAITSSGNTVIIKFDTPYAYTASYDAFLTILAGTWASIMSKQWAIAHNDWPGTGLNDGSWVNWHDPAVSPLDDYPTGTGGHVMMGSGPFEFDFLIPGAGGSWSIIRNGGQPGTGGEIADPTPSSVFWGGWGTARASLLGLPRLTTRGYLDQIVEYFIDPYPTRLAGFAGGSPVYDSIYVPRSWIATVWQQPGIKPMYPLPSLGVDAMFFTSDAGSASPFIGDGKWGETGIIQTFFSDGNARTAMAYSFDYKQYIATAYLGEATQHQFSGPSIDQPIVPKPTGMQPQFDPPSTLPGYVLDWYNAMRNWLLAWGGIPVESGTANAGSTTTELATLTATGNAVPGDKIVFGLDASWNKGRNYGQSRTLISPVPSTGPGTYYWDATHPLPTSLQIGDQYEIIRPGLAWTNGFYFIIVYNTENPARQTAAQMLQTNIQAVQSPFYSDEAVNKFHVHVVQFPWTAYLNELHSPLNGGRSTMPVFIDGWQADFPDVDDFAFPFMGSAGYYGFAQSILNPAMDNAIKSGAHELTDPQRNNYYQLLWLLYTREYPPHSVPLAQPLGRRWARDWVHGWYYNPAFSGSDAAYIGESVASYFYTMWKEDIYASTGSFAGKHANWEDITEDGKVAINDIAIAARAFGSYFIQPALPPNPLGTPGTYAANWDSRADLNIVNLLTGARADMKVNIKDLAKIAVLFSFVADPWVPGP